MGKDNKEVTAEILKVPVQLTGFAFKKVGQEWDMTLSVLPEHLHLAQPLQDEMGRSFIVCFVRVDSQAEANAVLLHGLEGVEIEP